MNPLVSILLPVHNGERYLRESIISVVKQTYPNWELIIINDGSTDSTENIALEFSNNDDRIKLFAKEHSGVAKSLNFGLVKTSGLYIARIDSDDIWLPEKLQFQVNFLNENPGIFLLGNSVIMIDEAGLPLREQKGFNNRLTLSSQTIRRRLLKNNLFCHSSVMFRYELIKIIGKYRENYKNSEDYEYWIRAAKRVNCEISERVLVHYRVWPYAVSFRRREQQIFYSFRARLSGLFSLGFIPLNIFYLIKFLLNSAFYLVMKNTRWLKQL